MSDLEELRKAIVQFTKERDWDQFHNGKDLALALSIEAAELNEAFLWKDAKDVNVDKVKEELVSRLKLVASSFEVRIINEIPKNEAGKTLYAKLENK